MDRAMPRSTAWDQPGQGDTLQPADDLAVSPAQLRIAPGQRQRLRIVRLGPAPDRNERAYRLLIAPQAGAPPGRAERHSLPVFLQPEARPGRWRCRPPCRRDQGSPRGCASTMAATCTPAWRT